jgi:arsenite methyltransferase
VISVRDERIKKVVRESYAKAVKGVSCCGTPEITKRIGYTEDELKSVPEGARFSFGCGNPTALASLKEGETVVDLGSGGGFDCFLAANRVGEKGKIIGVDMTPDMIDKARDNLRKSKYKNVEFRLGEIENLPVADNTADVVISNCVINLSPNKKRVFEEAFRVLKPGGRIMISDIVLLKGLPDKVRRNVDAYVQCISGAIMRTEYLRLIKDAGFGEVKILEQTSPFADVELDDEKSKTAMKKLEVSAKTARKLLGSVVSVRVYGLKPKPSIAG